MAQISTLHRLPAGEGEAIMRADGREGSVPAHARADCRSGAVPSRCDDTPAGYGRGRTGGDRRARCPDAGQRPARLKEITGDALDPWGKSDATARRHRRLWRFLSMILQLTDVPGTRGRH